MVLDKGSIKELYDNRDIIAQLGNLRDEMNHLPHGHQLQLLWEYMVLFINRYEYLMLEDKSAYIDAKHVYEVAPGYDSTKGPRKLGDIKFNEFVSKEMIDWPEFDDKNYVKKNDSEEQELIGILKAPGYKGDFADVTNIQSNQVETGNINTNKVVVQNTANANEEEIFSVLGESLFDGDINCFGRLNSEMIDVKYGEFAERPSLKTGSEQPLVGNNFITLDDFNNNHNTFSVRPSYVGDPSAPLQDESFITLEDFTNKHNTFSVRPIYVGDLSLPLQDRSFITLEDFTNKHNTFSVRPIYVGDFSTPLQDGSFITFKDLKNYEPTPEPQPIMDYMLRTWSGDQILQSNNPTNKTALSINGVDLKFNYMHMTGPQPGLVISNILLNSAGATTLKHASSTVYTTFHKSGMTIGSTNSAGQSKDIINIEQENLTIPSGNCKTVIGTENNTTYINFVNQRGLLSPRINFDEKSLYAQVADGSGNQAQILSNPTYTSIVNKDSLDRRAELFVFNDQCIMEVFAKTMIGFDVYSAGRIECRKEECFIIVRGSDGVGIKFFVDLRGVGQMPLYSTNDDNLTYTEDDFFTTRRDIKDMVKTTKTVGDNYEQIELPFNLFNRPISLIIRRIKEGNMFRDQLLTKTDNNIKIISDQYTAM